MSIDPQRLGKYKLQESLGRTGIAEVWKAFDPQGQHYVVLKVFSADLQKDAKFIARFWSLPLAPEAQKVLSLHRSTLSLDHPNIVPIYGFQIFRSPESERLLPSIMMDYIEGPTLADYIRNTSGKGEFASAADIVHLFASISAAIDYAHQKGVFHGNLKPTNILLDKHNTSRNPMGEPMLTDIGIPRLLGISIDALVQREPDTSFYISPEQAQGYPGNEYSDLYALGVILYEICTGVKPFQGNSPEAIVRQRINTMPPWPTLERYSETLSHETKVAVRGTALDQRVDSDKGSILVNTALINPNISPALSTVLLRSLAKDPEDRFPNAASMVTALANALNIAVPEMPSEPVDTANTNIVAPEMASEPADTANSMDGQTKPSSVQSPLPLSMTSFEPSPPPHLAAQSTETISSEQAIPIAPPSGISETPSSVTEPGVEEAATMVASMELEELHAPEPIVTEPGVEEAATMVMPMELEELHAPELVGAEPAVEEVATVAAPMELEELHAPELVVVEPAVEEAATGVVPMELEELHAPELVGAEPAVEEPETISVLEPPEELSTPEPVVAQQAVEEAASVSAPKQPRTPALKLAIPKRAVKRNAPASIAKQRRAATRAWTLAVLLIILVLLIGLGVIANFSFHVPSRSVASTPRHSLTPTVRPFRPTPTSVSTILGGTYKGTIYDLPANVKTSLTLTNVQQSRGKISGYLTVGPGLFGYGPFSGTTDTTTKHFQFTVTDDAGNPTLFFEGEMQTPTSLSGDYYRCNPVQGNLCRRTTVGYGIWNVLLSSSVSGASTSTNPTLVYNPAI